METTESTTGTLEQGVGRTVPEFVDWLAAAVIALAGLALTLGGVALTVVTDRELLAEGITSGTITVVIVERNLTEAEMLEFTLAVVSWTGWGLLLTGVALVLFAIGYAVVRHRVHQATPAGESAGSYRAYAVLGAIATSVLSFVPFSPVLGGGVAGYFEHYNTGRAVGAGGLSGLLAMAPGLAILVFVTVGLFEGLSTVGESDLGILAAVAMLLVVLFVAAYGAGLGALGGFLGDRFAGSRSSD